MKLFLASLGLLLVAAGMAFLLLRFGRHERSAAFHVCVECGRREWCEYEGHELVSNTLQDDGSVFLQRFGAALPPNHEHDWMVDGCIIEGDSYAYTGNSARVWIEILPRLADSAGSEALFREAVALTPERRRELIESFVAGFRACEGRLDEAFTRWNAQRHSR